MNFDYFRAPPKSRIITSFRPKDSASFEHIKAVHSRLLRPLTSETKQLKKNETRSGLETSLLDQTRFCNPTETKPTRKNQMLIRSQGHEFLLEGAWWLGDGFSKNETPISRRTPFTEDVKRRPYRYPSIGFKFGWGLDRETKQTKKNKSKNE